MTGRPYTPVEAYRADDADTLLITMGSFGKPPRWRWT
jgi:pyruvate/2-oxoacid:ferredoxin oxidoreductase alpha subunit